jgi:hypothetical protein
MLTHFSLQVYVSRPTWKRRLDDYVLIPTEPAMRHYAQSINKQKITSSLNVFDDGVVLLRSLFWNLSIVPMFSNHNVSRDGSSLETLWLENTRTMDKSKK